jgi:hypothetical protein
MKGTLFIKLTSHYQPEKDLYVNALKILSLMQNEKNTGNGLVIVTHVTLQAHDCYLVVKETPEEIIKMIDKAQM